MRDRDIQQAREHLAPDAPEVGGPRPEVLVLEAVPVLSRVLYHVVPRSRGRDAIVDDRTFGRGQERAVAQEEQMGVEDLRLVAVRPSGDERALTGDVVADRTERGIECRQLDLGAAGSVGDGEIGRPEPSGGPDRDPGGRGIAAHDTGHVREE